ncbi:MAG: (Fe-S)-binding protein [Clostridiales bacterium]|nr:(Fe-S)-binding protein [Clostridiales bacterium]
MSYENSVMFTDRAYTIAEACRFCWMCRHCCPVGLRTGREINTPRAKGLIVSLLKRGTAYDRDIARAMYECTLCGACSNDCVTGYEPPVYIREARTQALVDELVPPEVMAVIEHVAETGNIYGEEKPCYVGTSSEADVLVYIGDTAACRTPDLIRSFFSVLSKLDVPFRTLSDEPTSGADLYDLIGDVDEVRTACKKLAERIRKTGVRTVVCLNPNDAAMLARRYEDFSIPLPAKVRTATSFVADLLKESSVSVTPQPLRVTYHDNVRLSRELGETDPARDILAVLGVELHEMFLHGKLAHDCGSAVFHAYAPDLCALTAAGRWEEAARTPARTLVTASPEDYLVLSAQTPEGYEVKDLFAIVDEALA